MLTPLRILKQKWFIALASFVFDLKNNNAQGPSYCRNKFLNRADLQYFGKPRPKPAGDVSRVQSEVKKSVFAACPSVN